MSKVLVDRELLEVIEMTWRVTHPHAGCFNELGRRKIEEGLCKVRAILEAQPAEAGRPGDWEWLKLMAEVAEQDRPWGPRLGMTDVEMAYAQSASPSKVLELIAALSSVTAERDSLLQFKAAHLEWHEKTEWVQETAQVHEPGKHRADVLKDRIDQLRAEVEMMREDAERWRYVSLQGDDTHWLNLLRVDLEDFGGNINAAVDALIDGDTPVTAAKEA